MTGQNLAKSSSDAKQWRRIDRDSNRLICSSRNMANIPSITMIEAFVSASSWRTRTIRACNWCNVNPRTMYNLRKLSSIQQFKELISWSYLFCSNLCPQSLLWSAWPLESIRADQFWTTARTSFPKEPGPSSSVIPEEGICRFRVVGLAGCMNSPSITHRQIQTSVFS